MITYRYICNSNTNTKDDNRETIPRWIPIKRGKQIQSGTRYILF